MNLEKTLSIIYEKLDPWSMESPEETKDQIFKGIISDIKNKRAFPLERNGTVFYIMPETKERARLHLFSNVSSNRIVVENGKWLTSFAFDNIKSLQKMYGITPHKKFVDVAWKFFWHFEGTLSESHMTENQGMVDQYIFGITRSQYNYFYEKEKS